MSKANILKKTQIQLWTSSAGRCQYENCNKPLWRDDLTMAKMNKAYIAHIVADSPNGPRGEEIRSPLLANDINNLMLLCDEHHRLIDREDVAGHTEERLLIMKSEHEKRIELVTAIIPNSKSHVLLYGANIGKQNTPLTGNAAFEAMLPKKYPANAYPLEIGIKNSSFHDNEEDFWQFEEKHLSRNFQHRILPMLNEDSTQHLSIFALAPQPLLIKLGTLLTDLNFVEVYQRHREPPTWQWQEDKTFNGFYIAKPENTAGIPVLNISLSATITTDRIEQLFEEPVSIWTITHDNPNNDFLKSKEILSAFRKTCRSFFDQVKVEHGQTSTLHVFPAMPVSAAIEFGRVRMPKADVDMIIYDQNKQHNGFIPTLNV